MFTDEGILRLAAAHIQVVEGAITASAAGDLQRAGQLLDEHMATAPAGEHGLRLHQLARVACMLAALMLAEAKGDDDTNIDMWWLSTAGTALKLDELAVAQTVTAYLNKDYGAGNDVIAARYALAGLDALAEITGRAIRFAATLPPTASVVKQD